MKLILLSLSWLAGICIGAWTGYPWVAISAIVLVALLAFRLNRNRALLLCLCLVALLGGILRIQASSLSQEESTLQHYNDGGLIQLKGLVAADPEPSGGALALHLEAKEIKVGEVWEQVSGTALVSVPSYSAYRYGDLLQIEGELETPPQLEDFDWRGHLARRGIVSLMRYPEHVEILASGQGFKPQEWLYSLRNRISQSLDSALPEPQSSLAQAILLGKRSVIPDDLNQSFFRTGTTHIIAISGLNITIVAGIVLSFGVWLFGRRHSTHFWLAIFAVWGYAALTGMQAPVLRAAIMGSVWLFAEQVGRQRNAFPSLLFAAAVMVGIHPSVMWEASFQLSFAAMAGLILLTPYFQTLGMKAFRVSDEGRTGVTFFIDSISVTLGATLTTMPIIALYFEQVSLVSLPANLFALWAVPAIMVAVALTGVMGLFAAPLAWILGWVAWLFLSYMIGVVDIFSALPFASVHLNPGVAFVWGYYAVLGVVLLTINNRAVLKDFIVRARARISSVPEVVGRIPARFIIFPLFVVAALVWIGAISAPDGKLHVSFLDVGQGDAILIETPSGKHILVDGGSADGDVASRLGKSLSFWERNIDLVVLTHPHEDHLGGLLDVLRRYEVERVLDCPVGSDSLVYTEWRSLIEGRGIRRTVACAGQRIELGDGMSLNVLHAGADGSEDNFIDNSSIVLRLVYGDVSFILTSDIFEEAELSLLDSRYNLESTVLKVAHHGSESSSCAEFLAEVEPQVAVISVGAGNPFGHPAPGVLERLNRTHLYRTDVHGTIELITDGKRMWVKTER